MKSKPVAEMNEEEFAVWLKGYRRKKKLEIAGEVALKTTIVALFILNIMLLFKEVWWP